MGGGGGGGGGRSAYWVVLGGGAEACAAWPSPWRPCRVSADPAGCAGWAYGRRERARPLECAQPAAL